MLDNSTSDLLSTSVGPLRWLLLREPVPASADSEPPGWLTPEEIAVWRGLRTEKRRADWQRGRRAAKQLVIDLVHEQTHDVLALDQVSVLPHPDGWSVVSLPLDGPHLQPAFEWPCRPSYNHR